MKNKSKIKFLSVIVVLLAMLVTTNIALASEVTGTLSTGISSPGVTGIVIAPPTANPTTGVYTSAQSVVLTAPGSSSIRYTIDGSKPDCSSETYSGPITVSSSQTIEAVSCYPGNIASVVASFIYNINNTPVAPANNSSGGGGGGSSSTTTFTALSADANKDGRVDVLDFVILMANWGQTGAGNLADFDKNNSVDIGDFVILMSQWTA